MSAVHVRGNCPACGLASLVLTPGGLVTCSWGSCPRRTAAAEVLADAETEHLVHFTDTAFSITHPLRERLDGQLHECDLHAFIASHQAPPATPGRYRAVDRGGRWSWERTEVAS